MFLRLRNFFILVLEGLQQVKQRQGQHKGPGLKGLHLSSNHWVQGVSHHPSITAFLCRLALGPILGDTGRGQGTGDLPVFDNPGSPWILQFCLYITGSLCISLCRHTISLCNVPLFLWVSHFLLLLKRSDKTSAMCLSRPAHQWVLRWVLMYLIFQQGGWWTEVSA